MTAIEKYARLEGSALWKADPEAQRKDVIVQIGDASLVIADARSEVVLSHWSLPAVRRLNRGTKQALFAPDGARDGETLETTDPLLIEALETIRASLAPKKPLRKLRYALAGAAILAVGAAAFWLPGILVARTAAIVPPAMRTQIGRAALDDLTLSAAGERFCSEPHGRQALALLRTRVLDDDWRIRVIAGIPGFESAHLPGRLILLGQELVERLDSAEALAGWVLAEAMAAQNNDPLVPALNHAGSRATLALLTTGSLPDGALAGYAAIRLRMPAATPDANALGDRLDALGIAPTAYVLSLPEGNGTLAQALADRPPTERRADTRLLSDGEWLTLQSICLE